MAVPLHLMTGFLGAGKSTVLERLLADPRGERIAVLVNEVGELALDHHLLQTIEGDVMLLGSGCICCSIGGELLTTLERMIPLAPSRILVETTGIAEPAPILHAIDKHPRLSRELSIAGVIAVLDAVRGEILLDEPEARAQVELADRIIISKIDLAPDRVSPLRRRISQLAPLAEVREAARGEVESTWLLGAPSRPATSSAARAWLEQHGEHAHDIHTRVVDFGEPVDVEALQLWLSLVTQLDGDQLLRVKGILERREDGALFVLQSVQHSAAPLRRLEARPEGWRGSALVLIARASSEGLMARWARLAEQAARGDRRAAQMP